jgi:hypothetical protein
MKYTCECGKQFKAKDEHAGRRAICPACRREFRFPVPSFAGSDESPDLIPSVLSRIVTDEGSHPEQPETDEPKGEGKSRRPFWKDPIVLIGTAGPTLILVVFFIYLAWQHYKSAAEMSYTVIEEVDYYPNMPARSRGIIGNKRTFVVRLGKRRSEDDLRKISLELRARQKGHPIDHTDINYYLPGMEMDKGAWAFAIFRDSGLTVAIAGLTEEQYRLMLNEPAVLPRGSELIGIWMLEAPFVSTRYMIYRRDGRYYRGYGGGDSGSAVEMNRLPAADGYVFQMGGSSERWVIDRKGNLEIRNSSGKVFSSPKPIKPPLRFAG